MEFTEESAAEARRHGGARRIIFETPTEPPCGKKCDIPAGILDNTQEHCGRGACFNGGMALTGSDESNAVSHDIIGAGIKVHRIVGPGLFEKPYRVCLVHELKERGLKVREEVPVPLVYEGVKLDCVYRLDLIVNEMVVVEVKAIESITDTHVSQMLTYLRLTGLSLGIVMNFRAPVLKEGIKRVINTKQ